MTFSSPGGGLTSLRLVNPTEPLVSLVSSGRAESDPSARSSATTPSEITQVASLARRNARPKLSETVSMTAAGRGIARAIKKRSTIGRMIEPGGERKDRERADAREEVRPRSRQRMAGPHHEHHPLGVEVLQEEPGHALGLGEATEARPRQDGHRHDPRRHRRQRPDADRRAAVSGRHQLNAAPDREQRLPRVRKENLPRRRQPDPPPLPVEQWRPEDLLSAPARPW